MIIIALGFWVSSLIGKLLIKGLTRKGVDASIHSFLRSIVVWLLRFAVILSALSTLGFNLNSFIAALGAAGLTAERLRTTATPIFCVRTTPRATPTTANPAARQESRFTKCSARRG